MIQRFQILCILIVLAGCNIFDSPTKPSHNDLLELSINYNNERITNSILISLNWSEITIEDFKEIKITRLNEHRDPDSYLPGEAEGGWITLITIINEFATSWVDTIYDDAPFRYRVDYYNKSGNYRRGEATVSIRPTSHLTIPTDVESIKSAVESVIIDSGDTVFVQPGIYEEHSFTFGDKELSLIGIAGAGQTALKWIVRKSDVETLIDTSFISIQAGLVQGLGIIDGHCLHGGGINAKGNATIKQCIIRNNIASHIELGGAWYPDAGYGGGLYLSGNVKVENCIIDSNRATREGTGIFIDQFANNVKIINCVLNANDLHSESSNVSIENTIITGISPSISTASVLPVSINYSHMGEQWIGQYPTNIIGELLFERLTVGVRYHLLPGSVCIDAGNPDPVFNDPDGTRNDIGVYGGPLGGW